MLERLIRNAVWLMKKRASYENIVDKINIYPVELVSIYIVGSYLKKKANPKDLDVIALYRHTSEEEIFTIKAMGRQKTYRDAITKLRAGTEGIDLQLYNVKTYNFTVNPFVPKEQQIKLDVYKKVWENEILQN
jgi:predicted nucleotidyltransferase